MIRSIASRKAIAAIFTAAWSIFGAQSGYGQPPVEEGKIYWTNPARGIHRSSLDGSNVEQLVIPDLRRPDKIALDIAGGKMYWTDGAVASIYRSDLDGSNLETLVEGYGYPGWSRITDIALDLDAGKIYWTVWYSHGDYLLYEYLRANLDGSDIENFSYDNNVFVEGRSIALDVAGGKIYWMSSFQPYGIQRANLDGSNAEDVITAPGLLGDLTEIALDVARGKIYWTNPDPDEEAGTIQRANLDGSDIEPLWEGVIGFALDVDGGKIYWTDARTGTIQRADLNGEKIEYLFDLEDDLKLDLPGPRTGFALDLDGDKIYWTDAGPEHWTVRGTGTIQRADLDGKNREVLFDPIVRRPHDIALDIDKMYWTDTVKGTIHQADLNGQNREVLVTGLDEPRGITLTAESKIYWTDSGTGKIQVANLDGSQVKDIVIGLGHPHTIALDKGKSKIYWGNDVYVMDMGSLTLIGSDLQRANLNGSQVEKIETVPPSWYEYIALDEDRAKIYWTSGSYVFHSDLDGSHLEKIDVLDWAHSIGAIALDLIGNKIYWTALFVDPVFSDSPMYLQIYRSNLDGSNVERIYVEETYGYGPPTGIALYIPHPTSVSTYGTTPAIPTTTSLDPNFPNPFNAGTQIAYRLASPGLVRLEIYNVLGQPVRTLVNQFQPAGFYQVPWDVRDQRGAPLAAGVYLTRLRHPDGAQTRRLLYLK